MTIAVVKANREIGDAAEQHWDDNTCRDLRDDFTKEVSRHRVHIIIDLSQEDWPLVWEDKDNVLDGIESDSHCHEEESTVSVLHSLGSAVAVLEQNDNEDSSDDGNNNLHVGSLRKSEDVEEVSLQQKTELITPSGLLALNI